MGNGQFVIANKFANCLLLIAYCNFVNLNLHTEIK